MDKWLTGEVLLDDSITEKSLDFGSIFGNTRIVEIEIGTGKGTFLLARAKARPEVNFLGIEWARSYAAYSAGRFHRSGLTNIRILHSDATDIIPRCVPDESIWRVHIFFPDPWPKRRHHRRRSIQVEFINQLRRVLKIGGQLIIVTDHLEYFQHIGRVLANVDGFIKVSFPQMADSKAKLVGTNFERKYIAQGRSFFNLALMKLS